MKIIKNGYAVGLLIFFLSLWGGSVLMKILDGIPMCAASFVNMVIGMLIGWGVFDKQLRDSGYFNRKR